MAAKRKTVTSPQAGATTKLASLDADDAVVGVPGPGRWLVVEYAPAALYSLKASFATSSVGRSLVTATPYAIKMALVDAAFRVGLPDSTCAGLVSAFAGVAVRVSPPDRAVVTHTFVKVRQEPKTATDEEPYISAIAYRDMVSHRGRWMWAFDLATCDQLTAECLVKLAPCVRYIGKRGSFVQYLGLHRRSELASHFSCPVAGDLSAPLLCHFVQLDDFGPDADLQTLSTFTEIKPKRDKHRKFVSTMVPLGIVATGPGFTEYAADTAGDRGQRRV